MLSFYILTFCDGRRAERQSILVILLFCCRLSIHFLQFETLIRSILAAVGKVFSKFSYLAQVKMAGLKFSILIFSSFIITFCLCCESELRCDQNINDDIDECSAEYNSTTEEKFDMIQRLKSRIRSQEDKINELEQKIKEIESNFQNILGLTKFLGKATKNFWESLEFRFRIVPCLVTRICFSLPAIVC